MGLFTFLFRRRRRRRLDEDGNGSGSPTADSRKSRRRWKSTTPKGSAGNNNSKRTTTAPSSSQQQQQTLRNRTDSPTNEPTETTSNAALVSPLQQQRRRGPDLSDGTAPPIRSSRSPTGPVDTDDVSSDDNDEPQVATIPTTPPSNHKLSSKPVFHLADDTTDNEEDDETDDGDCSTFNISTDAEDIEYESMRRRLGVLSKTNAATANPVDTASLATSQEDGSVFPNLQSEDEGTLGTSTVTKEAAAHSILQLNPATGASLVPEAEAPFTAAFPHHNNNSTSFGTSVANAAPAFKTLSPPPQKTPRKLQASVKDSPDRRRPKHSTAFGNNTNTNANSNTPFMDTVYGNKGKESAPTEFDPFFAEKEPAGFVDFADFNAFTAAPAPKTSSRKEHEPSSSSRSVTRSSSASVHNETSLEELLATAKSKKSKKTSISSAPAMTAAYLRQQHNLQRKTTKEATGVTDIIHSLEASRRQHYRSHSDAASRTSTRSGKSSHRRRRTRQQHRYPHSDSDDDEQQPTTTTANDQENWLFDEVTGALGPKGIAADLESLSGRSGNSRRRRHARPRTSGNDSVDSSRHSRDSRRSRYSHRSYMSQMSEQSRSVANDLLRLERQLAMVGESTATSVRSKSRHGRSGSSSTRSRWTVTAPAGKLGIILANKADAKGTVVSGVRTSSSLADTIAPGDRIVAIDGEDVSLMTVSEITTIMARKAEYERTLTVLTTRSQPSVARSSGVE